MKFSIIIVTYNRHKELHNCLKSIQSQNCVHLFEVIVIFNGDRSYLDKSSQIFKDYKLHFIHKTTPSDARNHAILNSHGEYLFFLDDGCTLPADYLSKVDFTKSWEVLGGPDQTPPHSTRFQTIVGKALSSNLCMGVTSKRHGLNNLYSTQADETFLNLYNLWIKSSLFKNENFKFNSDLFRNEENFLLKQLRNANKIIHYSPELYVYHNRKNNLEELGAVFIKNGEGRIQIFSLFLDKKDLIYLLPLLWFFYFLYLLLHPHNFVITIFAIYSLVIFFQYVIRYRSFSILYVFLHYFILCMYSIGLLKGIWKYWPALYTRLREKRSFIKESKSK